MMDWAITIGLMLCVIIGGCLSAAQATNYFRTPAPEPFNSQYIMQIGMAWMLASIAPFLRSHPAMGMLCVFIGFSTFVQGCMGVYRFGKRQAHEKRVAMQTQLNEVTPKNRDPTFGLTKKAASKLRRRNAKMLQAAANDNNIHSLDTSESQRFAQLDLARDDANQRKN